MEDILKKIREESGSFRMQPSSKAWDRVRHKFDKKRGRIVRMRPAAWAVAASAVGVVAIAALLWYQSYSNLQQDVAHSPSPDQLETLDPAEMDGVAQMAVDYSEYLRQNRPEWLELLNKEDAQF